MVVKENRHAFNKELDDYLSSKESDDFLPASKQSRPKPEALPVDEADEEKELEDYEGEGSSQGIFGRLLRFFNFRPEDSEEKEEIHELEEVYSYEYDSLADKEAQLMEQEEAIEEKKRGILERFVRSVNAIFQRRESWNNEDEADIDQVEEEEGRPDELVLHDIKTLGKITVLLMKEMTPHKRKEFKESPEFSIVKEILRRYKLIR
ncbi:MAG: hypothetical protein GXP63_03465 [DPANN group archaeon]|nr:hypothetical protein [DPANN group archaeon]